MKKFIIAFSALLFLYFLEGNSQTSKTIPIAKIIETLREKVVPSVQFTMEKDSGYIQLLNVTQGIGINKTIKKGSFFDKIKNKGPYIGPIYWIYDFEKLSTSTATIQQGVEGMIELQLHITTPDTLIINVKKNAYSCVTRTIDVQPHNIQWTGKKAITVTLKPREDETKISLEVYLVTVQGILMREDQFNIAPSFKRDLEKDFLTAFEKVFQNKQLVTAYNKILKAEKY